MATLSANDTDVYYTVDKVAKLSSEDQDKIKNLLNEVESRTANWINNAEWKLHKTVKNRINLKDDIGKFNEISVYKYIDKEFFPKISIWKVEAFVPEKDSNKIFDYYNIPGIRTRFDKDTMSTFYDIPTNLKFIIDSQNEENDDDSEKKDEQKSEKLNKICINVCKTTKAAKGWVSPRIFINLVGIKYCKLTNEYCTISTFLPNDLNHLKPILKVTENDTKINVVGQNLSLYLGVSKTNENYTKVTYILQSNNGGWIPQWAVEMGMVDQHMIAIFRKMTLWLLHQ